MLQVLTLGIWLLHYSAMCIYVVSSIFPSFETVKIDRMMVSNTTYNYEVLSHIAGMLKRLGKEGIAEEIETKEQLEIVKANRISYVQGYYYSKPLPPDEFFSWLEDPSITVKV